MVDQHTKSPLVLETESGWEKSFGGKIVLPLLAYAPWGFESILAQTAVSAP